MEIIGLDLHKRESQLSIKADDGSITDRRIATSRERFTAVFGARPPARILLEASTESEWVARHLESLGHEVIVADPNYAPMYANRSRRTKTGTDRRPRGDGRRRRTSPRVVGALRDGAGSRVLRASGVPPPVVARRPARPAAGSRGDSARRRGPPAPRGCGEG